MSSTEAARAASPSPRSAREVEVPPGGNPRLVELVMAHGNGDLVACSTLQDGLETFETSFGALVYTNVLGHAVVLGAPLAARSDRAAVVDRFLATGRTPLFCYVRNDFLADLEGRGGGLRARGLVAGAMGHDVAVDLPRFFAAPGREIASAVRKAEKRGLALVPFDLCRLDETGRAELAAIDRAHLSRSECTTEMRFLDWPLAPRDRGAHLRRTYFLESRDEGRFGVVALNPVFDEGRIVAYLLDVVRFLPTKLWGVYLAVAHAVAKKLAKEDRGVGLSLGFSPLAKTAPPAHGASRTLALQFDLAARYLRVPFVERLATMKALFPQNVEGRYFLGRSRLLAKNLALFLGAQGISLRQVLGPDLAHALRAGLGPR